MRSFHLNAVLALLLSQVRISFGEESIFLRDRFLKEAPESWAQIEKASPDLDFEAITVSKTTTPDADYTGKGRTVAKVLGNMKLLQLTEWPDEGKLSQARRPQPRVVKDRLDILNEEHLLSLRREGDAAWKLLRIDPRDENARWLSSSIFRSPWSVANVYFPAMCRSKGFELTGAEEVREADRSLIKVAFKYTKQTEQELNLIREGWALLDPLRSWSIVRYEVQCQETGDDRAKVSLSVSNEYRNPNGSSLKRTTSTLEKPSFSSHSEIDFIKYERHAVPADEFKLSHYGLELPSAGKIDQYGFVRDFFGAVAPPLEIRDARDVPRDVKLSDYHGKWVLLEFWGPNCQPCIERGLPELMALYDAHRQQHDQFEILAICVTDEDGPKTIEQLDRAIAPAREKAWQGRALPFPVLIDRDAKTFDAYHPVVIPAKVLIDPDGLVVKDGDEKVLDDKLRRKN